MHLESRTYMAQMLRRYGQTTGVGTVLDVGAGGPGGVYRSQWEAAGWSYFGVDLGPGPDVDLVLPDPHVFPFADNEFQAVISGQMLEHNPMFWMTFLEMSRVLCPGGLMIHIAPSRGREHRAPLDCWRFYPDAGSALQRWANREGYNTAMLESFVGDQDVAPWNDFVAVFVKDGSFKGQYPSRIQDRICNFRNGLRAADNAFTKWSWETEDDSLIGNAVVRAASA